MSIDWTMLWHMGGQGPYVWGVYGAAGVLLATEGLLLWAQARQHRRGPAGAKARRQP